jgi:hypothetical protein
VTETKTIDQSELTDPSDSMVDAITQLTSGLRPSVAARTVALALAEVAIERQVTSPAEINAMLRGIRARVRDAHENPADYYDE